MEKLVNQLSISLVSEMHVYLSLLSLGSIFVVEPNLSQNGNIHHHLEQTTDNKLGRRFSNVKISRFEDIAARPHEDHLEAICKMEIKIDVLGGLFVQ